MRVSWYLGLCAVVACKPKGLMIEVPGDNVELFIAASEADCMSADHLCAMAPPDPANPTAAGPSYKATKRWITNTDELVTADRVVTDGVTDFFLEPDASVVTIPAMLAVSFDSPNTNALATGFLVVHDVDVQPGKQERMQLVLDPYMPLTLFNPAGVSERMQLWRKPSDSQPNVPAKVAACALVEHDANAAYPFESFSPPTDTDCDETEKVHDCDKFAAFSSSLPNDRQLDCLATPDLSPRLCIIGGHACRDGLPTANTACVASQETYCTSTAVCSDAQAASCTTPDCVDMQVIQGVQLHQFGLHCSYVYANGVPCAPSSSTSSHVTAVLSQPGCLSARVSASTSPLEFDTSVDLDSSKVSVSVIDKTNCTVQLGVEAGPPASILVYVEVAVPATMPASIHHHVIPVVIDAIQGGACNGTVMSCDPVVVPTAADAIMTCR